MTNGVPTLEVTAVVQELERRLEQAKHEWELRARQHTRVAYQRWRARRARRSAAELARALAEYKAVWRALQQARLEAYGPDALDGVRDDTSQPQPKISLNNASLEQLRAIGMSLTQAKRVVRLREEGGGLKSLDDLDAVPGFSAAVLARVKGRLAL